MNSLRFSSNIKAYLCFIFILALCACSSHKNLQTSSSVIDNNITKEVKKEAKRLQKEGWVPTDGMSSIETMLTNVESKRNEVIDTYSNRYLFSTSKVTRSSFEEAKLIAEDDAKADLSSQIRDVVAQITTIKETSTNKGNGTIEEHKDIYIASSSDTKALLKNCQTVLSICKREDNKVTIQIVMVLDKKKL